MVKRALVAYKLNQNAYHWLKQQRALPRQSTPSRVLRIYFSLPVELQSRLLANFLHQNQSQKVLLYLGPLASTYSLWLWDGIRGLVADSTAEEKNWVVSTSDYNWSLPSSERAWDHPTASSRFNDRRQNGAFEKRQQCQQAGHLKRSNVGEGQWGPTQAWAEQHIPSIAGDQNLSTSEQKQAICTGNPDAAIMTGVFNGNTPLQITVNPDKRFKSLPPAEILPRNTILGGYIFVCNNDTMQEDLKRQLFGMISIPTCLLSPCNSCMYSIDKLHMNFVERDRRSAPIE